MSKKSWFGSDEEAAAASKAEAEKTEAEKKNPSTAGSQDPNTPSSPDSAVAAHPTNILRDDRNVETDVGHVNPHNNAAAQVPAAIPLDQDPATAEERAKEQERLKNPKSDKDRADALTQWGKRARARGNVTSADWEEFQLLTGERTSGPTAESIAAAERERDSRADREAQRTAAATKSERAGG